MDLIDILMADAIISKKLPPAILNLKGVIPTHFELPLSGNAKGDVWVVSVDNSEWIWMSDNSSGTISDYEMMGVVFDLRPYRTAADQDVIDSGKQAKITASGMLKGDGNGGVTSATAGTDYDTASNIVSATAAMTPAQAAQTVQNLGIPMAVYPGVDLTVKFAEEIANYTDEWAWIQARIQAGNYAGININDYIPVVANGNTYKARIMGINTYTGYGDTAVGNHIDWIFEELWPTRKPINPDNYNNGLIPKENVSADGTATTFVLTKEMNQVAKIEAGGSELSGWTYDASTYTITFEAAPAAGTLTVTGTGTEYPWLASDAYHFANSLVGQIPNSSGLNPAVKHVDYTQDGIYYHLPQKLKDVIIQKRAYLPQRYNATSLVTQPNAGGWKDIGYIWFPTEAEICGRPVWGNITFDIMGSRQYDLFQQSKPSNRSPFWTITQCLGNTTYSCAYEATGIQERKITSSNAPYMPVCFRTA